MYHARAEGSKYPMSPSSAYIATWKSDKIVAIMRYPFGERPWLW